MNKTNQLKAEKFSFNDPDINTTYQEFDAPKGHGKGNG
ncbi:MAG: carboxymethylenebutenolidase [Glaciecola sp.]|jgi:carboxymethylenebutenolidase